MMAGLVLGTAQLTRTYGVAPTSPGLDERGATRLLQAAADLGWIGIDTAPSYGDAEAAIGAAEVDLPILTKLDPELSVSESVRRSVERTGREPLDVVQFHRAEDAFHPEAAEHISAVDGAQVTAWGVSVYDVVELDRCRSHPYLSVVQAPANVLDQRHVPYLAHFAAGGGRVYVRSVFLQGALLQDPEHLPEHVSHLAPLVRRFQQLAREAGRAPLVLALLWTLQLPGVSGVIVGCETVEQLIAVTNARREPALHADEVQAISAMASTDESAIDPRRWPARS